MLTTFRLPPFLLDAISRPLFDMAETQEPSQVLDNGVDTYLRRWYVERSRERGNVYLHNTLRSDYDDEHHDHPWDNLSICLKGTGIEEIRDDEGNVVHIERPPGTVVFRSGDRPHRILVDEPIWTLFLTGPKMREWGFLHSSGWMHHQDFFNLRGYS